MPTKPEQLKMLVSRLLISNLLKCETPKHPPYLRSFLDLKTWTLKMFQCLSVSIECFCIKKSKISDYRHSFCNLVFSCPTSCKISPDFRNVFSRPENAVNIIKPTPFRCFVSAVSRTSVAEVHPGTQVMDNSWSQLCSIVQSLPCCIQQGFPQYRCLTPAKRRAAPRVDEPVTSARQSSYNML